MATRTAITGTGLLKSASSTWGGAAPPVVGTDKAIIPPGSEVIWDTDGGGGSNAGAIGHGIEVQGTSASVFGKLIIPTGIKLQLQGNDNNTNRGLKVNRWGQVEGQAGAIIEFDCASDGQSGIKNDGIMHLDGVLLTVPSANRSWNNAASTVITAQSVSSLGGWDRPAKVYVWALNHPWISNAAGTDIGSFGDSSLVITGQTPGTVMATPVASIAACIGTVGAYYCNHKMGVLWWHMPTGSTISFTANYQRLLYNGPTGIDSTANTTGNEITLSGGTTFEYWGSNAVVAQWCVQVGDKFSVAASPTTRLFSAEDLTFRYCKRAFGFKTLTGTQADPIVVRNIMMDGVFGDAYGHAFSFYQSSTTDVLIDRCVARTRGVAMYATVGSAPTSHTRLTMTDTFLQGGESCIRGPSVRTVTFPDAVFDGVTCIGLGAGAGGDQRIIGVVGGTAGHRAAFRNCLLYRGHRALNYSDYLDVDDCIFFDNYHHGISAPTNDNDMQITGLRFRQLIFRGGVGIGSGHIDCCYNTRSATRDVEISRCTFTDSTNQGSIGLGDRIDQNGIALLTKVNAHSCLTVNGFRGIWRMDPTTTAMDREHVSLMEYMAFFNVTNPLGPAGQLGKLGLFLK